MVKQIKITDEQKFSCEYMVNGKLISKSPEKTVHEFDVVELPCKVQIMLNPYKIKPTVRIDDIMVNYGLAEITPWDHMLEFTLDADFFDRYFKNIIQSKGQYLKLEESELHKKIGLQDLSILVKEIEGKLK